MTQNKKTFIVSVNYLVPDGGTVYVTALSEDEARSRVEQLFSHFQGVNVVHCQETEQTQMELDLRAERDALQEELDVLKVMTSFEPPAIDRKDLN